MIDPNLFIQEDESVLRAELAEAEQAYQNRIREIVREEMTDGPPKEWQGWFDRRCRELIREELIAILTLGGAGKDQSESVSKLPCEHDWVGDDDCVYCENERLRGALRHFYDYGYDRLTCEKALENSDE